MIKKACSRYKFKNFSVRYEISVHPMLYILEYTRFIGRNFDDTGLHDYYKKRKLSEYFISFKEFNQNRYKDLCTKLR